MKKTILLTISLSLMFASCTNELDKRIQKVSYGTSFGECVGFCRKQMSINSDSIVFTAFCDVCMTPGVVRKDYYSKTLKTTWDSIQSGLSPNSFFLVPAVSGCPDCADGGAEWLEILLINGETHKVTFEYGNEPGELKAYIPVIRKLFENNNSKLN